MSLLREFICFKILRLFLFIAPEEMRKTYINYFIVAGESYRMKLEVKLKKLMEEHKNEVHNKNI